MEIEEMFREHQRALYAFFFRVVGNRHDAEELTQETFLRACTAALRFRGEASARTWLFGIARHVLMEASRKGLFADHSPIDEEAATAKPPDSDLRLDLEQAFATLEVADREILMLVDYLGFSPSEAAALGSVEGSTFRMRLHRARRRLRDKLEVSIDE
jgi:RNA polymerase sigma-70 factor (ECF subfamily)